MSVEEEYSNIRKFFRYSGLIFIKFRKCFRELFVCPAKFQSNVRGIKTFLHFISHYFFL